VKLRLRAWQGREAPLEPESWSLFASTAQSPAGGAERQELLLTLHYEPGLTFRAMRYRLESRPAVLLISQTKTRDNIQTPLAPRTPLSPSAGRASSPAPAAKEKPANAVPVGKGR